MITSRPKDAGFIDPRNSIAPMLDALDALPGQVAVDFCEPPTLERLEKRISEARKKRRPFHIVHFDGHGTYLPLTGVGALAFERDDDGREAHLVEGRKLGDLLSRLEVPLVILEACRSSALSERPIFGSVAPALLQSGVGSVIAFSHSVHIEAAKLLVGRFYEELADGLTVGQALEEARARELAEERDDLHQLAVIAQNVGSLYHARAEEAEEPEARATYLRRALSSIQEGLVVNLEMEDEVGAAASYQGIGVLHLALGELDQAEEYLHQGLKIYESLNHPESHEFYGGLALVAAERGDAKIAAEWQAKRDARLAELEGLSRDDGT